MAKEAPTAAWQTEPAREFGRLFLQIVADESNGEWLAYRDVYDRVVRENADNWYVSYLSDKPARRAKVKYVILEAMAGFPGMERRKDGDGQTARVWFRQSGLRIVADPKVAKRLYRRWRQALLETAKRRENLWVLPEERIVFRNQPDRKSKELGSHVALGVDLSGEVWAVQINEAETAGDPNVTSAVALDSGGRPFLLRQGRLQPNSQNKKHILYAEFKRLTGLTPVTVANGDTKIKRDWYVVTALDIENAGIRCATARFVDQCVIARTGGLSVGNPQDLDLLKGLFSGDEKGGVYTVGGRTATDPKEVRRHQGEVWLKMAALLRARGLTVEKPRHAAGYEVDADVRSATKNLLIEIKSGAAAHDVYGGMGQLQLYRKLLPRLSDHVPVLLLPGLPHSALVKAIEDCGVELCTFEATERDGEIDVVFSDAFLTVCGVEPEA